MQSDCLISNYLSDLDCDTIAAFTPGEYARRANCRFLHSSRLLAGEDIPGVIMHKTVSFIVSLFHNSAVNSLCYTYIQIYIRVALIFALIFITVPNPKTCRGHTILLPMIADPRQLQKVSDDDQHRYVQKDNKRRWRV